jgi:uncharacterized protein with PIN domain
MSYELPVVRQVVGFMKFIADVMLGKLAKRMRLLGFDVLYDRTLDDNEIIRLSLEQQRVILTRDSALAGRPLATNHLFLTGNLVKAQLDQVLSNFHSKTVPGFLTRCSLCNEALTPITREEAKDLVPPHVYEKKESFLRCESCKRIYWVGTHVKRMTIPVEKK